MKQFVSVPLAVILSCALPLCANAATAKPLTPQQQRMKDCSAQATGKSGSDRRAFMSQCMKGGAHPSAPASAAPEQPQQAQK